MMMVLSSSMHYVHHLQSVFNITSYAERTTRIMVHRYCVRNKNCNVLTRVRTFAARNTHLRACDGMFRASTAKIL